MVQHSATRLLKLTEKMPELFQNIKQDEFDYIPAPGKWSKKEILGHLIDSATNNHQRFVRVQFEYEPVISYDQNNWNQFSYHRFFSKEDLIHFWTIYNQHLAKLMLQIPKEKYANICALKNGDLVSLEFLIQDYVAHQEHHLKQIVKYEF